ncbi:hypothetical protein DNTS_017766, partial [Danionella cerebrum]
RFQANTDHPLDLLSIMAAFRRRFNRLLEFFSPFFCRNVDTVEVEEEMPDEEAVIVVEPASPAFMMPNHQSFLHVTRAFFQIILKNPWKSKKKKKETEVFCPSSEGELEDETDHIDVKEALKSKPNKALSLFLWLRKNFRKVKVTKRSGEKKSC